MSELKKPLLSICIPTYNRAELLRSALLSLAPQIRELGNEVELIVSDNCSTDHTKQVVEQVQQCVPIKYNINSENIGAFRNALSVVELANGNFSWILGDDDFVRIHGVRKIVDIIKKYHDIDYIFVSLAHINYEELKKYPYPVSSKYLPNDLRPDNRINVDSYLEKWEQLIDPDISSVFLGGIQVSVFRTSIWNRFSKDIRLGERYSSLESTYPHLVIFAHGMIGRKAYYIGEPLVIVVDGNRDWFDYVPSIVLVRLNEILDLYESLGVDQSQINKCRKGLMSYSGPYVMKLLTKPKIAGREYVSFRLFFRKYWTYSELWISLFGAMFVNILPRKMCDSLSKIVKKFR